MGNPSLTRQEAQEAFSAVIRALKAGHIPSGVVIRDGERSAKSVAGDELGLSPAAINHRLNLAEEKFGLIVPWELYVEKIHKAREKLNKQAEVKPKPAEETEVEADPIIVRNLQDRLNRTESLLRDAHRKTIADDSLRKSIFGLVEKPLNPPSFCPPVELEKPTPEALILFLSDVHNGEVIDFAQMGGRNSYNQDICQRRLERYFHSVVELGVKHWSGPPPGVIYLILGGDMISGEIHEELAKTNDLLSIPAVRSLSEWLIAGIEVLRAAFPKVPINVVSVPGNHGRTTRKPEMKGFALDSYDTLVAWTVERWFTARNTKDITFSAPASGDALIKIHGWTFLFTHGDRIGSRGGAGFIGPAATAARGMQRVIQDYAAEGVVVDVIVIGHFHTAVELEQGFVNGCLSGPSEYSRSGRMRSHPASQWLLSVHPRFGVTRRWKVMVGSPSEGSIYNGRATA